MHIEPLTASDWEIIELHASFLELNLLSQIRCVSTAHSLSVYLSPTSTASIRLQRVEPEDALSAADGFAKISPDAEIIVAPKTRQRRPSRSGAKSTTSTVRTSGRRKEGGGGGGRDALYLRGVVLPFEEHPDESDAELEDEESEIMAGGRAYTIYVDPVIMSSKRLRSVPRVLVSVVRPPALEPLKDPSQQPPAEKDKDEKATEVVPATKLIAAVQPWELAPDTSHVALSRLLAAALQLFAGDVGPMIRIEAAPPAVSHKALTRIKIHPFQLSDKEDGLKWAGGTKRLEEMAVARIHDALGPKRQRNGTKAMIEEDKAHVSPGEGVLEGPLTDGMVLPAIKDSPIPTGGIVRIDATVEGDAAQAVKWYLAGEKKPNIEIASTVPRPPAPTQPETLFVREEAEQNIVGIDKVLTNISSNLVCCSSVLLSGAHGSGKSAVLRLLARRLTGSPYFYRVIDPGTLARLAEERIGTVKESISRWLIEASWLAGKTGRSLLLLDDLDRLVAAEAENADNSRVRQVAELFITLVRRHASRGNVVLLASCQAKESMHELVIGAHVFREMIPLKAMTKEGRYSVLQGVSAVHGEAAPDLDLRDVAAKTEGYMPGDLVLLSERARHEAVVRMVDSSDDVLTLTPDDFTAALAGFVPAGLRGVKLQTSGAGWGDIGGLLETRRILLETLEWPTKYAPIFASCPLRLRSGLLLYGYPGCGKTLLASAVAGECGLNFISVKGPEILNKYIGASEKSVRDLFERAQGARPCVLFFDEFDSIAPKRGHDSTGVTDRVVNQMLTQMDGAEGLDGVYVLAATSRPDLIDPALLRPGRLDKSLLCDLPEFDDRLDILRAVSGKVVFSPGVQLEEIARRTEGFSGADLQAVVYNAHLEAVQAVIAEEVRRREEAPEETPGKNTQDAIDFLDFAYSGSGGKGKGKGAAAPSSSAVARGKERARLMEKVAPPHSSYSFLSIYV